MDEGKVNACIRILEELYGEPLVKKVDPVDLLVMTMLSQNTSDTNSLRAFGRLKDVYCNYEDLVAASEDSIADTIRSGGLAEIKAHRIVETLSKIKQDAGAITLDFLADVGKEDAMNYLVSLPGVGPKTASVVLLFAFGFPFMPVDTHVHRVSRRLGLVPENASVEKCRKILEQTVPPQKYFSLHLNLIRHGRRICRARNPQHERCALRSHCDCFLRSQKP
ncbi:MAG: endonuclease III [Methanothrix sp.]|nr:endonuclease III [Methanothrix sp.]